eukprot:TRINITY_DN72564_c0_g1_i1.p1 TRINITY_DN72564_c0_g1~~TRINITY_DN72564_c0_g1_i1.p1  ORF type:complete len:132 (+),score=26.01 TRINITY_DN72564_c0_g1_i1:275-670(+)
MKITILALAAVLCTVLAAPVARPFVQIPQRRIPIIPIPVIIDQSLAVGGPGGDGGDASVIGAIVEGGVGGDGVSGSQQVFNQGIIAGGDGTLDAVVGNGAVGTVQGSGSISGSVTNTAIAGDGGPGGAAFS